ncbi:MAG: SRPBCC domain-containing protein, partial [Bacteroidota bacterium]|nr:SRPBCC domain-containing protein [Bacteroidota bacterium]
MKNDTFVLEQIYSAPVEIVWRAITSKEEMKQWYFNFKEFVPEVGFEFQFWG